MDSVAIRADRLRGALLGLAIGDAISMPLHWYYRIDDIDADFPSGLRGYEAPKKTHPGSFLKYPDSQKGIVGHLMLQGKEMYWNATEKYHYHVGLASGMNTLNAHTGRLIIRHLTTKKEYSPVGFLNDYVQFLTTRDSHPDV